MAFDVAKYLDGKGVRYEENKGREGELVLACPRCPSNKDPKLGVNTVKKNWNCWRCSIGGRDLTSFVAFFEGIPYREAFKITSDGESLSEDFESSLYQLSQIHHLPPPPQNRKIVQEVALPEEFIPVWEETSGVYHDLDYLNARGISRRTILKYRLGFCREGRYAGRVVLPAYMKGKVRTFQARAMLDSMFPKYDSPGHDDKAFALYGHDQALGAKLVVVVEGSFDVLGIDQAGYAAVGLMGKSLSIGHMAALLDGGFETVPEAVRRAVESAKIVSSKVIGKPLTPEDPQG